MSLSAYDKALESKLKIVFPNVINSSEDSALFNSAERYSNIPKKESDKSKATIALPMISFWRVENPPNIYGSMEGNFPLVNKGLLLRDKDNYIQSIPISIQYQVSIWSDRRQEVDDIYREFLMYILHDEPYLRVKVDKFNITEDFTLLLVDSSTNIDTSSFIDGGRMYRQDIILEIDNAKLWYTGSEVNRVKDIEVRFYTDDSNESDTVLDD